MNKLTTAALATLALAATITTPANADDPINPVQGAVCNLYYLETVYHGKDADALAASISSKPAAATFVDAASDFKPSDKKERINSYQGMWTGWMKQAKAGKYTFTCQMISDSKYWYSIWINGQKCVAGVSGQNSFNVDLEAGFNSVKIVAQSYSGRALSITYKKAGSVKEPISLGPENMYYDDEE